MTGDAHQDGLDLGLPADAVAAEAGAGSRGGLSWSWEVDVEALLAAVIDPAPWNRGPVEAPSDVPTADSPETAVVGPGAAGSAAELDQADAELAEYLDAVEAGRSQVVPLSLLAGRVVESLPAGPGLAGWLGTGQVAELEDGALAGVAASYRRLASWAQAGELSVVAELASRSAAADGRIGTDGQGRPARVPKDACAEVSLALTMSQAAASWWADLAVTLRWRLAATGAALAAGAIDLARARLIADATACLDDDTARAVQDRVLPKAGGQTTAQLRAALRRAVIAADPQGADRRRDEAEKQAKVMLYPDADGTASLGGYNLPGIRATAAMARITALARALQASGAGGGIDLLRSHVLLGLLLGTLPYIPPATDAPPDQPPPDDDEPSRGQPPSGESPGGRSPDGSQPDDGPPDSEFEDQASYRNDERQDRDAKRADDGQSSARGGQPRDGQPRGGDARHSGRNDPHGPLSRGGSRDSHGESWYDTDDDGEWCSLTTRASRSTARPARACLQRAGTPGGSRTAQASL